MAEKKPIGTVLVAGAGVSGIKAALELAEIGYKVLLTDASPQIGGILAKLDNQFPSDHCGMCRILPMVGREYASQYCMRKGLYHENIEILPFTELTRVEGDVGNYTIELLKKARYIDTDKCNGLGECIKVCPVEVPDEFNHGLTQRKAVYKPVPHSTPQMLLVDMDVCTNCGECVKVCPTNVINLGAEDEAFTRHVHSIILASGVKLYNLEEFEDAKSWAVSQDVISALAFERIISGTGTFDGQIKRPSDGKPAKKIAWVQCMGSRNRRQKRDYCSSICCMFALKEAMLARQKGGDDVEATIFYMDMRTFGKDFYRYYEKAVDAGVKFIRCRVQEVMHNPDKSLSMRYYDSQKEEFFVADYDMVVLSTGQIPHKTHAKLAKLFHLELNCQGLLPTQIYDKVKLVKPGVFLCGSLMGLTDLSEAISSGIAAAGQASTLLSSLDVTIIEEEQIAEPTTKDRQVPLISVVLCKCSEKVEKSSVDFGALEMGLKKFNFVGEVNIIDMVCSDQGKENLLKLLKKSQSNRLIIGACHPFMYRKSLKNLAKKAGFAASLIEIFDLSSIVHKGFFESVKKDQTHEAYSEIISIMENLKLKPALHVETLSMNRTALVVGGGIAGMHASFALAQRGVDVHLVEKSDKLGGYAGNNIHATIDDLEPVSMAKDLMIKVLEHKNIILHKNCEVAATQGSFGAFETRIRDLENQENQYLSHGAAIIATGGLEGKTAEYEYGNSANILTQAQLREGLSTGKIDVSDAQNIVMIQCVGSREKQGRKYCSRICCIGAIANALAIQEKNPDARIFILYRDVMTYGFAEQYYTKARGAGIVFVSYDLDKKPEVELVDGKPVIKFTESVLNSEIELSPDFLILSPGVDPEVSNREVGKAFDLPVNDDGFFIEADSKWRPIEFLRTGFYVAGVAHSPMTLKDAILQAEAAAQKVYAHLSSRKIHRAHVISKVHDAICVRCQRCVDICPYDARSYDKVLDSIMVDAAACQACGMCGVACQNNAARIMGFSDKQIMAVIDAKLSENPMFMVGK
ncbi:MAG: CoB--CoM heterodisulfide reductase iron-sulfur subunit A family protein [Desulfobacteraceae bacterium]|nr:CoB--CoM heterodisulfide reductase iron-sulfur subunit A family protein [Desulfobacteraceae bacterium]